MAHFLIFLVDESRTSVLHLLRLVTVAAQVPRTRRLPPTSPAQASPAPSCAPPLGSAEGFGDRYHNSPVRGKYRLAAQTMRRTLPIATQLYLKMAGDASWCLLPATAIITALHVAAQLTAPSPNQTAHVTGPCLSSPRVTAARLQQKNPPPKLSPRTALPALLTRDCKAPHLRHGHHRCHIRIHDNATHSKGFHDWINPPKRAPNKASSPCSKF